MLIAFIIFVILLILVTVWILNSSSDMDDVSETKSRIKIGDMTAGNEMVMNLTLLTGHTTVGNWNSKNNFDVHILGECSIQTIEKIRDMISSANNDCSVMVKHDTDNGTEIIYDD